MLSWALASGDSMGQEFRMPPTLPLPTLGGVQFWTDHRYWHGWRLQKNALLGQWRVVDERSLLRAQGDRSDCEAYLQEQIDQRAWPAPATRVVLLIHGLGRSRRSMKPLVEPIESAKCGAAVLFEYASTRDSISGHAVALRELLEGLPGAPRINLVGHSLGNIVVRRLFSDLKQSETGNGELLHRIDSCVMLGPPNNGSRLAARLQSLGLFTMVMGESAAELGQGWQTIQASLEVPPCPFGIIAGNMQEGFLRNPYLPESSDLVVTTDETRLSGAVEVLEVPVIHSFLMQSEEVQQAVVNFLKVGRFVVIRQSAQSSEARQRDGGVEESGPPPKCD
jgi:pimeloyl-ACP methyl ester carboxylesterase